jgi:hypothetical protein
MKKLPIVLVLCTAIIGFSFSITSNSTSKTLEVDDFTGIKVNGSFQVFLKQGSKQSVKVEGEETDIDKMSTTVKNGIWTIQMKSNNKKGSCGNNYSYNSKSGKAALKVYITMPTLTYVSLNSSGKVTTQNKFNVDNLDLNISGNGKMRLGLTAKSIESNICGSGKMVLNGSSKHFEAKISGSGDVDAEDLQSKNANVSISGSGDINVHATDYLKAKIAGSGDVLYKGSPDVHKKITGSGSVSQI